MRSPSRIALGLFVSAAFTLPLWGQGTITDAPATFVRGTSPWDTSPDASFTGVSATLTQDHLFETGWWFRVAGGTQETFFPVPTTQNYTGTTSTNDWTDVGALGLFSAQEVSVVKNTAGPSGFVTMTMKITNLSAVNPLSIDVFHMADIDLAGAGSDSATLLYRNNHLRLTDPSGNVAEYRGVGAKAYLVRPFGATDVAAELSNATVTDFNNTGVPFGPADFTGGFQWTLTIPASGSRSVTAVIAVNDSLVRGDFGDDAKTDLLLRNSLFTKHVVWQMDGLTRTAGIVVTPDVADTNQRGVCTEDFTGDAVTDIQFQNVTNGAVEIWAMGGATGTDRQGSPVALTGTPTLPGTITDWSVAACGDVDRDGKNDILWRNNATVAADPVNGQKLRVWLMNNEAWVADLIPTPNAAVDGNWQVTALLDYDADGNTDFLWYNYTSGRIVQWVMDPVFVRTAGAFTSPNAAGDNNWKVVASGEYGRGAIDVNPTGAGDIIWRNENSGRIVGWLMDGVFTLPSGPGNTRVHGQFTCPVEVGGTCNPLDPPSGTATSWFIVGPR